MPMILRVELLLLLLVSASCGAPSRSEPVARLQGSVKINGQPLPADAIGSVIFMPRTKGQAPAAEAAIEGGQYRCDKAPLGEITALFHISRATGKIIKDAHRRPSA